MAQTTGTTKAAAKKALLTADRLREILSYAPNTGEFRWLLTRGRARAGKIAGVVSVYGYRIIRVGGRDYRSARLAWLYMTGAWPLQLVDHIDLNRVNDRWSNLRAADHSSNHANRRARNRSGIKGVRAARTAGKWTAYIQVRGHQQHLGTFSTPDEAASAYGRAAREGFGDFARTI